MFAFDCVEGNCFPTFPFSAFGQKNLLFFCDPILREGAQLESEGEGSEATITFSEKPEKCS